MVELLYIYTVGATGGFSGAPEFSWLRMGATGGFMWAPEFSCLHLELIKLHWSTSAFVMSCSSYHVLFTMIDRKFDIRTSTLLHQSQRRDFLWVRKCLEDESPMFHSTIWSLELVRLLAACSWRHRRSALYDFRASDSHGFSRRIRIPECLGRHFRSIRRESAGRSRLQVDRALGTRLLVD